jgi:hypothetical protein
LIVGMSTCKERFPSSRHDSSELPSGEEPNV